MSEKTEVSDLAKALQTEIILAAVPTTMTLAALGGVMAATLVRMTRHMPGLAADVVVESWLSLLRRQVAGERKCPTPEMRRPSPNWNGA